MSLSGRPQLLTTAEVAELLRLKERKVYEMVRQREIPCTRVSGKWLFPRDLIESWVLANAELPDGLRETLRPPPVLAGSHDPLLAWAIQESESGLALLAEGSHAGLERFAAGEAMLAGLHLREPQTGGFNAGWVAPRFAGRPVVLITWAWRAQALIHRPDAPAEVRELSSLLAGAGRIAVRQAGSGSRTLFDQLAREAGVEPGRLAERLVSVHSETELAHLVADGTVEAAFGIAAATAYTELAWTPVLRERFDLLIRHRDYFEPPMQRLLAFTRSESFRRKAQALPGMDVGALGKVVWNG